MEGAEGTQVSDVFKNSLPSNVKVVETGSQTAQNEPVQVTEPVKEPEKVVETTTGSPEPKQPEQQEKVETPPTSTATTGTVEVTPITKTKPEPTAAGTEPAPAFDENKWFKEKFGENFKSVEDILNKLSESEKAIIPASETLKRMNDFLNRGGSLDEWYKTQSTDFTKLSDYDLMVAAEKAAKPHKSLEDIEYELKLKYRIGEEGDYDDKEIKLGQIQLKDDAAVNRPKLIEQQQVDSIPAQERQRIAQQKENERIIQEHLKECRDAMSDFNGLNVKLDKDRSFALESSEEWNKEVSQLLEDPLLILQKFPTAQQRRDFIFKALAFDTAIASAAKNEKSVGQKEVLDKMEHPSSSKQDKPRQQQGQHKTPQEAMYAKMKEMGVI